MMDIARVNRRRRTIRLKGYDYAQAGAYFVTICTQGKACSFGEIVDGEMQLNDAGRMVVRWWNELEKKFPEIEADLSVVMPNHFHGIIAIVGAARCGRPDLGHPRRGAPTLGNVVDWFKTMTTNAHIRGVRESGWPPFEGKLWQRNYYEHVIRDETDLASIREYVAGNPARWAEDRENPARVEVHG